MQMKKLLLLFTLSVTQGFAQQPTDPPSAFAVATIKPSVSGVIGVMQIRGNRFATEGTTFGDLFKYAFTVNPNQMIGGPEWLKSDRFDVLADPETDKRPTSDQMKALVRQLLTDRFHLRIHQEQRLLPVYWLVTAPSGPKLAHRSSDPSDIPGVAFTPPGTLEVRNASLENIASFLQRFALDRPVVNNTGVEGKYDLILHWDPQNLRESTSGNNPSLQDEQQLPSIYTAVKEQLGLKLQAAKSNITVYVIDQAEKPSEN